MCSSIECKLQFSLNLSTCIGRIVNFFVIDAWYQGSGSFSAFILYDWKLCLWRFSSLISLTLFNIINLIFVCQVCKGPVLIIYLVWGWCNITHWWSKVGFFFMIGVCWGCMWIFWIWGYMQGNLIILGVTCEASPTLVSLSYCLSHISWQMA